MSTKNQSYNPTIDPGTGDYVITKGDTVPDYTLKFPAYVRMKVQRKKWLYAPDDNYGADFYKVLKRSFNTPRVLETMTAKALQPLIDDKRATEISAFSSPQSRNMCNIEVSIVEANRSIQTFEFNPVE
jgi:phage gp46-like protein